MGHALIVDDDTDAAEMLAELAVSQGGDQLTVLRHRFHGVHGQPGTAGFNRLLCRLLWPASARGYFRTHYQRLPDWFSSKGLILEEIASRALKMRERTVPIGQFMTSEISS